MVIISITGTPGTGKSTLSKKLLSYLSAHELLNHHKSKLKKTYDDQDGYNLSSVSNMSSWKIYDVTDLIKKNNLSDSKLPDGTLLVDTSVLVKFLLSKLHEEDSNVLVDSFFSHLLPSSIVDLCVVCNCDISILNKRLHKRKYSPSKIRENLDAEITDYCGQEAIERGHKIFYFDTSTEDSFNASFKSLIDQIKSLDF